MPRSMSTVSTSTSPHGHSTRFSFSSILISQLTGQKLSEVTTHNSSSGSERACVIKQSECQNSIIKDRQYQQEDQQQGQ